MESVPTCLETWYFWEIRVSEPILPVGCDGLYLNVALVNYVFFVPAINLSTVPGYVNVELMI